MFESRYKQFRQAVKVLPASTDGFRLLAYSFDSDDLPLYVVDRSLIDAAKRDALLIDRLPFVAICLEIIAPADHDRQFIFIAEDKNDSGWNIVQNAHLQGGRALVAPGVIANIGGGTAKIRPLDTYTWRKLSDGARYHFQKEMAEAVHALSALMALLATRGIATETVEPPAALNKKRLKHGKPLLRPYIRVKVGKVYDREGREIPEGERRTVTPHIRAGHSRRQHHGPRNSLVKSVFIPPTFVNYVDGAEVQNRPRIVTL